VARGGGGGEEKEVYMSSGLFGGDAHLEDLALDGSILRWALGEVGGHGLDSSGTGWGHLAGPCLWTRLP
jgi:hypothetical protein